MGVFLGSLRDPRGCYESAFEMIFHAPFNGLHSFVVDAICFAIEKR